MELLEQLREKFAGLVLGESNTFNIEVYGTELKVFVSDGLKFLPEHSEQMTAFSETTIEDLRCHVGDLSSPYPAQLANDLFVMIGYVGGQLAVMVGASIENGHKDLCIGFHKAVDSKGVHFRIDVRVGQHPIVAMLFLDIPQHLH